MQAVDLTGATTGGLRTILGDAGPDSAGTDSVTRTSAGSPLQWWNLQGAVARYVRDLLVQEMAHLRPSGWRWPARAGQDVHLVDDAGADSLELLALSAALCEALDLQTAEELAALHEHPTWQAWAEVVHRRLLRDASTVRFSTSGSTGKPKRCVHPLADLDQEMQAMLEVLGPSLKPGFRVLTAVRSSHIYGFLFSLLLPAVASRSATLSPDGAPPDVVDLCGLPAAVACSIARPGDLIIGFPDWWAALNRSNVGASQVWPEGVIGLSSTAACPQSVAQAAREGGLSRWIEIYGSSETAGVGWRDDPGEPFTLHVHWRRVPAAADEASDPFRKAAPVPASEGFGSLSAGAAGVLQRATTEGRWSAAVQLSDHLQWLDDRRFIPLARRDGQVQVGGVNVDPEWVRQKILLHPSVSQVAVRLHPTPSGMRLKAFVVPQRDLFEADAQAVAAELRDHLRSWCARQLVPAARPFDIRIGSALPRNEMGKLTDWEPGWQR